MRYIKKELGFDNVELPPNLIDDMDKIEDMVKYSINSTHDKRRTITVPKQEYLWKVLNLISEYKNLYMIANTDEEGNIISYTSVTEEQNATS
jgi:hypothetical protein